MTEQDSADLRAVARRVLKGKGGELAASNHVGVIMRAFQRQRTGRACRNAALEELILGLDLLYGYEMGYKLDKLPESGDLLSELSNVSSARNKPVLGHGNFIRESGIGIQ